MLFLTISAEFLSRPDSEACQHRCLGVCLLWKRDVPIVLDCEGSDLCVSIPGLKQCNPSIDATALGCHRDIVLGRLRREVKQQMLLTLGATWGTLRLKGWLLVEDLERKALRWTVDGYSTGKLPQFLPERRTSQ